MAFLRSGMMLASKRAALKPASSIGAARYLNLHEYQAKNLMDKFNVNNQAGKEAASAAEAVAVAESILKTNPKAELIVKAQIHAGGRGKGTFKNGYKGGVQICTTPAEVEAAAKNMLGQVLVTKQTGEAGQECNTLLINEGLAIDSEKYFAILMDRAFGGPVMVASAEGGMDIEEVAESNPDAIVTEAVDITKGVQPEQTKRLAEALGFEAANIPSAQKQMSNLYDLFINTDATQVEINPLSEGSYVGRDTQPEDGVFCVDCKLNFDDNAEYRQKDIYNQRDTSMEDPRDVEADEVGVQYIGLDGNIGCMVNGAGLAMASMDIIKLRGGEPANFCDLGGGVSSKQVADAFRIVSSDSNVKAILINIFGGIVQCDTIATGIVEAVKEVKLDMPLVVRLEGTNVEAGKKILSESGVALIQADDLDDAAVKAVAAIA